MAANGLALAPFSRADFAVLTSWFDDQTQLTQWGGPAVRHPLDDPQLEAMLPQTPVRGAWMTRRDGEAVGHAQAINIDTCRGVARLGRIVVAPAHRGQGLAVPMLHLVLDQLFATPQIERVDLGVYTWNHGAIRTYARLGFVPCEIRRASARVEGQEWDLQEMSLRSDLIAGAGE